VVTDLSTLLQEALGHRTSADFDFFSNRPFSPDLLVKAIGYVRDAEIRQLEENIPRYRVVEKLGGGGMSMQASFSSGKPSDDEATASTARLIGNLRQHGKPAAKLAGSLRGFNLRR
jgi:hypothetical protein